MLRPRLSLASRGVCERVCRVDPKTVSDYSHRAVEDHTEPRETLVLLDFEILARYQRIKFVQRLEDYENPTNSVLQPPILLLLPNEGLTLENLHSSPNKKKWETRRQLPPIITTLSTMEFRSRTFIFLAICRKYIIFS